MKARDEGQRARLLGLAKSSNDLLKEAEDVRATAELARTTSEFLGGARSVGTVLDLWGRAEDCIARHKGASAGRRDGTQWGGPTPVQAGAACLAEEAVRDAVKSRLGAACAEAMTVGRRFGGCMRAMCSPSTRLWRRHGRRACWTAMMKPTWRTCRSSCATCGCAAI
ncbi:unnamed protein product [Prorocentrum cordatum]|uniref:Uncharacterized protein n=1 Tax=Prorocentrum cordatum TaxID=2364126 RepID=A0ABN9RJ65_9DINO|nr:unnamed protein product [Polarella glacialis]